jgi:hypothetical protein
MDVKKVATLLLQQLENAEIRIIFITENRQGTKKTNSSRAEAEEVGPFIIALELV